MVLLLSEPPLVNSISLGCAPKDSASFFLDSSNIIMASLPAQCGLEGFANARCSISDIAAVAFGKSGELAL